MNKLARNEEVLDSISRTCEYGRKTIYELFEITGSYDEIIMLIAIGLRNNQTPITIYETLNKLDVSILDFYNTML